MFLSKVPATSQREGTYRVYRGPTSDSERKLERNVFQDGDLYFNFGDVLVCDSDYWVYFHDRIGDTFRYM